MKVLETTHKIELSEEERIFLKNLLQNPHPEWKDDEAQDSQRIRKRLFHGLGGYQYAGERYAKQSEGE